MCGSANTGTTYTPWTTNANQNPGDGTAATADGNGTTYNGGPIYWRFKASALSLLTTDSTTGLFTAGAKTALYTASNWEPVSVPTSQYRNFANWYAFYRYRNLMARTSMTRVFGVIGTPTSSNVRVLWQNINTSKYGGGSGSVNGLNGLVIAPLDDTTTNDPFNTGKPYRQAFFNWLYQVPASGSTPTRTAEIRAGNFLCNGVPGDSNCNPSAAAGTNTTKNPYWQAISNVPNGAELACRQNFHILMTDGLYNQPPISVSGNASNPNSGANLGPHIPDLGTAPGQYDDDTVYATNTGANPTTIYNHSPWTKDADGGSSYSDIAFDYWANNLRPDLSQRAAEQPAANDHVLQYFPDQTTWCLPFTSTATVNRAGSRQERRSVLESGERSGDMAASGPVRGYPGCVRQPYVLGPTSIARSPSTAASASRQFIDALCKLAQGSERILLGNAMVGWPQPNGNSAAASLRTIDDPWHAALEQSRRVLQCATDPSSLVSAP